MGVFDGWGRSAGAGSAPGSDRRPSDDDGRAIERYRYLLRTASPETIEAAHAEAFAGLTPDQRRRLLAEIAAAAPAGEPGAASDPVATPESLARYATRAEMRRPGVLERTLSAAPAGGPGIGGLFAGSLAGSVAGTVLGGLIAQHFFTHDPGAIRIFGFEPAAPAVDGDLRDGEWATAADPGGDPDAGFDAGFDAGSIDV